MSNTIAVMFLRSPLSSEQWKLPFELISYTCVIGCLVLLVSLFAFSYLDLHRILKLVHLWKGFSLLQSRRGVGQFTNNPWESPFQQKLSDCHSWSFEKIEPLYSTMPDGFVWNQSLCKCSERRTLSPVVCGGTIMHAVSTKKKKSSS